jgi:hypothetical protein
MDSAKLGPLKPSQTVNDLFYLNNGNVGVDSTLRPIYSGNGTQTYFYISSSQVQMNCNLGLITKPILDTYRFKFYNAGTQSSSYALNIANGNYQKITLSGNLSLTIEGSIESGNFYEITLIVEQTTGGHSITFPASCSVTGVSSLSFSTAASAVDVIKMCTFDGGTKWYLSNLGGGSSSSFSSPMTTNGDIITYSSGSATRLAIGSNGQVLTVSSGSLVWATPSAGFSNPMTTNGDIIIQSSGSPARLAIGSAGQFLGISGGLPAWTSFAASNISSGQVALARGGTGSDLSATGGTGQVVQQSTVGGSFTVGTLAHSSLTGLTSGDPHTQYLITAPSSGSTRNIIAPGLGNHKDVLTIQQSDSSTYPGLGTDNDYFGVNKYNLDPAWMLYNNDGVFPFIKQTVDSYYWKNSSIKFWNSANTFSVTMKATSSLASDVTFNLPTSTGSSGAFLKTDGSGGSSWSLIAASDIGSGTIATARLGSGTANSSTVLYGDQTYKTIGGTSALSQITSNQNDYSLGDTNFQGMYTISSDANGRTITGLASGSGGRVVRIMNTGSYDIIFSNQSTSSTAANRIQMPFDLDMVLRPNDCWTLIYDSVSSRWFVTSGYEGYASDPDFVTEMHDDFVWGTNGNGTFGELGWSFNNNGGTCAITADETSYVGAAKISSGSTASGRGELVSNNPVNMSLPTGLIFEATVRFPTLSDSTSGVNAYTAIVGISNSMSATGGTTTTQSIAFTYDRVNVGTNWTCLTANASRTATDSTVAVSTSYQRLKFVYNNAGTSCKFYINGNLVATNSATFPSSGPYSIKFGVWNDATASHTSLVMYVENFKMRVFRTTRRA